MKKILFCLFLALSFCQSQAMAKDKVLVLLSSHHYGYWASEVTDYYDVLKETDLEIVFATPDGRIGIPYGTHNLDKEQVQTYRELASQLAAPKALDSLDYRNFAAIYVPGGAGPMFDLYDHPIVNQFIKNMYQNDKLVAAVCHGPAALAGVKLDDGSYLIEGKKVTAKSNAEENEWARKNYAFLLEDKMTKMGSKFSKADPYKPWVVQDGLLITGQNPASTKPLAELFIKTLNAN